MVGLAPVFEKRYSRPSEAAWAMARFASCSVQLPIFELPQVVQEALLGGCSLWRGPGPGGARGLQALLFG
jgi:hypothetical protein